MKFAHMADVHLGAWRDPKMSSLVQEAFSEAVSTCLDEGVDFVVIAGDFLNTSLPSIDVVRDGVKELVRLKNSGIPTYVIPGSHDYSTSGKTMLNVLEEAGVVTKVNKMDRDYEDGLRLKFTEDPQTGAKLTGILGRRGALEKGYYEDLDREHLESEDGFKIFLFHSAIEELKPKRFEKVPGAPVSLLPKGFDYYAGGHVHMVEATDMDGYENIVYPGPLFPASFDELEELEHGGFYIYDDGDIERKDVMLKSVYKLRVDAENKSAEEVELELEDEVEKQEFVDTIVLVRVEGQLSSGRVSDIDFSKVFEEMYEKGAYFVMKNTSKLTTEEFEEVKVEQGTPEEIERRAIEEHTGQVETSFSDEEKDMTRKVMKALGQEKDEGEKKYEYEERVQEEAKEVLGL